VPGSRGALYLDKDLVFGHREVPVEELEPKLLASIGIVVEETENLPVENVSGGLLLEILMRGLEGRQSFVRLRSIRKNKSHLWELLASLGRAFCDGWTFAVVVVCR
jgi:hypothetical protein